ncbi:MAG: protein-L-isoaspartate O-methyltransferase, partial [Candidatus Aminicenantes bacterium]|nr:protein-L-isoaspartate O-methyltransferase [Candidatus Aminicenantes bacterium]
MKAWNIGRAVVVGLVTTVLGHPGPAAGQTEADFRVMRESMVRRQIAARGIKAPSVLQAMARVPRHLFVPAPLRSEAYDDHPLPIGGGQTISQPYIVAFMSESLAIEPGDKVLEIGTGSGYQAAVLACLTNEVFSVEIDPGLARTAAETLEAAGFPGVRVMAGDGFFGWPGEAPFDAIIVTASPARVPPRLFEQLKEGGRLIIPLDKG